MEGIVKYSLDAGSESPLPASDNLTSEFINLTPTHSRVKQIWAIGGGKGGVGKSLISSSLAIALSQKGNKVIAIDLDLGGANLHTILGIDLPDKTLNDFFCQRETQIEKCVVPSIIPNLALISGAQDSLGIANLLPTQKAEFLKSVRELDADYLIFDLGAGTSFNTLDFFLYSDIGIITLLPEPTSIENGYRFIKSAYYRYLMHCHSLEAIRPIIKMAMDQKNIAGIKSPRDLIREVNNKNPELTALLRKEIEKFKPNLIINQTRTQSDIDIGSSVKMICKKHFGIDMDYLGNIDYDSSAWQAVRRKRPLMLEFPNSKLITSIEQIVQKLIKNHSLSKNSIS